MHATMDLHTHADATILMMDTTRMHAWTLLGPYAWASRLYACNICDKCTEQDSTSNLRF